MISWVAAVVSRDVAGDLRRRDLARQVRKRLRWVVAVLPIQGTIVNRAPIEPRRRAGLQSTQDEASRLQSKCECRRRWLDGIRRDIGRNSIPLPTRTSRRNLDLTQVNQAPKEGAGGQHDTAGANLLAVLGDDADTRAACIHDNIRDRLRRESPDSPAQPAATAWPAR